MRLLLWHCKEVTYRDVKASDRPRGVHTFRPAKARGNFTHVLLTFVCVEKRDRDDVVASAVDEILRSCSMLRPKNGVLLMPFAHLSSQLAKPVFARHMLERVAGELSEAGQRVELATFGFHKDFRVSYVAYGHPGSVEFREIPPEPHDTGS